MFATDRDLLAFEPELFRDVGWAGQRLIKGVGDISGTTLTLTSYDNTFAAAGVNTGNVVMVDGVAYEITARLTATTATISRIRPDPSGAIVPPAAATGKPVVVTTFLPQIALAHRQILRWLGIDPDESGDGVRESNITNASAFREAEALGALSQVLYSAAGPAMNGTAVSERINRSRKYQDDFFRMVRPIGARIDADGDGIFESTRRAGIVEMERA